MAARTDHIRADKEFRSTTQFAGRDFHKNNGNLAKEKENQTTFFGVPSFIVVNGNASGYGRACLLLLWLQTTITCKMERARIFLVTSKTIAGTTEY